MARPRTAASDGTSIVLPIFDHLKWRIQPDQDSEITGCPLTDGQRIVLTIRRGSQKAGWDAVVVIGEEQGARLCIIGVELPGLSESMLSLQ